LKTLGCLARAAERDDPLSISERTSTTALARILDSVCCSRMLSARRMGRPEFTIVANCREKTARCFSFGFLRMLNSRLMPAPPRTPTFNGT
jgi:hypothetical protein